jgi:hypothetical protein
MVEKNLKKRHFSAISGSNKPQSRRAAERAEDERTENYDYP